MYDKITSQVAFIFIGYRKAYDYNLLYLYNYE